MRRRVVISVALGGIGAVALLALYVGLVSWAQGVDHALELMSQDRVFVAAIAAGFGTQIGLFAYIHQLRRAIAGGSVAIAGTSTTTSTVSMLACCAHHLTDVLPVVGLSGLAVFLMDARTPLMLLGLAMSAVGIAVMVRELRRISAVHRALAPEAVPA